jgi:hypothetical protein
MAELNSRALGSVFDPQHGKREKRERERFSFNIVVHHTIDFSFFKTEGEEKIWGHVNSNDYNIMQY